MTLKKGAVDLSGDIQRDLEQNRSCILFWWRGGVFVNGHWGGKPCNLETLHSYDPLAPSLLCWTTGLKKASLPLTYFSVAPRWAKSRDRYCRIASEATTGIRITSVRWRSYLPPKHRNESLCRDSDRTIGVHSCNIRSTSTIDRQTHMPIACVFVYLSLLSLALSLSLSLAVF